jgi:hypothetical protein
VDSNRRLATAVGLDVFVVILFVAIGRRNHEESSAFSDVIETGAPFLIGLAIAWLATRAWRRPSALAIGLVVWPVTVLAGMIVRRAVFDRGTATAFVVVATVFLGAGLVGWRAVGRVTEPRRRRVASGDALIER